MKKMKIPELKLQRYLNKRVDNKTIFGTVISVSSGSEFWTGSSGNLNIQSQYYIASVTKLYITAIILKLTDEEKLDFEDKISKFLTDKIMENLHVFKEVDYSKELNVRHLLSNTSGLADYFEQERENGKSLKEELISKKDQKWTCEKAVQISKKMGARFKPGQKGKAYYSDTNFQLLGRIIENITGKNLSKALNDFIFNPLELKQTYLYQDVFDTTPSKFYYKDKPIHIPQAMSSFGADGGIVSTAGESLTFLRAFFEGKLFSKKYINEIQEWNNIFFPFQYGMGIAKFKLPRFFSPFKPFPELIGHPGSTGSFVYYCPKKDIYIAGTINQVHNKRLPYMIIIKIINTLAEKNFPGTIQNFIVKKNKRI